MAPRRFDIVVFGATGYTGRLVTKYLAKKQTNSSEKFTWAIAGRSKSKLEELKNSVGAPQLDILIANSEDSASMEALCQDAVVVIGCAGPFGLYGMPLVDACMKKGAHYVDITGEFPFVRRVIEKYHSEAESRGILIVPQCGFDSIPSDLGNYLVHDCCLKQFKTDPVSVEGYFKMAGGGGGSRGTLESIAHIVRTITPQDMSPVCLNPKDKRNVKTPVFLLPMYNFTLKCWSGPFLMAGTNEKTVRRTNALNNSTASYCEGLRGNFLSIVLSTVVYYALYIIFILPVVRTLVKRLFPPPGEGPSEKAAMQPFRAVFVGKTSNGDSATAVVSSEMGGYPATAVFVAESALCIAHDIVAASAMTSVKGGVLTPMTALGSLLLPRLARNGIKFEVK